MPIIARVCRLPQVTGKAPLIVEQEVPAFVANRLQAALRSEALRLVEEGIETSEMIDQLRTLGIERRLAIIGLDLTAETPAARCPRAGR